MGIQSQTPDILGERQSGQDVRTQNVMACQAVANIVKSSLGPVGLDKAVMSQHPEPLSARGLNRWKPRKQRSSGYSS